MKAYRSIQEKHGYKFHEYDEPHNASTWTFVDEENVRERLYYPHLKAGMKVLDIGAGYGSYTLAALARGCKVISIVPQFEVEGLWMNVELNGEDFIKRFKLISAAVYSRPGLINLKQGRGYARWAHLIPEHENKEDYERCTTIDKLLRNDCRVDFIKMDVEGFEVDVLQGAKCTIARNKPIMLIENHQFLDNTLQKRVKELVFSWNLGYVAHTETYHHITHTLFTIPVSN